MLHLMLQLLLLVVLLAPADAGKDYYKILGVSKKATDQQLKKAYRKQAMRWHPDKHSEGKAKEKATEKFQEIAEAFETLSDLEKRRIYDLGGEEAVKGQPPPGARDGAGARPAAGPGGPFQGRTTFTTQEGVEVDPEMLSQFAKMFGGGRAFGGSEDAGAFDGAFGSAGGFFPGGMPGHTGFGGTRGGFGRGAPRPGPAVPAKQGGSLFGASGPVRELEFDNHEAQINKLRSKGPAVLLFYASGGKSCPKHCHGIQQAYAKLAEMRQREVPVVALQCLRRRGECSKYADVLPAVVMLGKDESQDHVLSKATPASYSQLQSSVDEVLLKVSGAVLIPAKGTAEELKAKHLAHKDQLCGGQFCLLLVERGPAERAGAARAALKEAAGLLASQPVHVFYVRAERHPDFVNSFALASSGLRGRLAAQAVLYRPKFGRYELFEGDVADAAALADFAAKALSRGTALPHRVQPTAA